MSWNPFAAAAVLVGLRTSDRAEVVVVNAPPTFPSASTSVPHDEDISFPEAVDDEIDTDGVEDGGAAVPPVLKPQMTEVSVLAAALDVPHEEARLALNDPLNRGAEGQTSIALAAAALRSKMFKQDEWRWREMSGTQWDESLEDGAEPLPALFDPFGLGRLHRAVLARLAPAAAEEAIAREHAAAAGPADVEAGEEPYPWHVVTPLQSRALSDAIKRGKAECALTLRDFGNCTVFLRQMVMHRESDGAMLEIEIAGQPRLAQVPAHWTPQLDEREAQLIEVERRSTEWQWIEASFQLRCPSVVIEKVERVQDIDLWQRYSMQRAQRAQYNGGDPNERWLFHGTNNTAPRRIWHDGDVGFDARLSSAGYFGTGGCYFSESSLYSDRSYAYMACCGQSRSGCRCGRTGSGAQRAQIFLASVVCGQSKNYGKRRDKSLKRPPDLPSRGGIRAGRLFDSINSAPDDPDYRMWVVWNSAQAYPRYVVTYSSLPKSHDAGDRSPSAAVALRTLGCAEPYIRDALPPPHPPLPRWCDPAPALRLVGAAAQLAGAATKRTDDSGTGELPWEWEDGAEGSGQWRPYTRAVCDTLDAAFAAGTKHVTVDTLLSQYSNSTYDIDLDRLTQTKRGTGYVRAVRHSGAALGSSAGSPTRSPARAPAAAAPSMASSAALPSAPPPPARSVSDMTLDTVARACRNAARGGSFSDVETILASHPQSAAKCNPDGQNALHCVAMRSLAGSSVSAASTPAANISVQIMHLILACGEGLSVNAQDNAGRTALWIAAGVGEPNRALVAALISEGATVDLADEFGVTALAASSRRGCGTLVEALLEHGADANARCRAETTPLIAAAEGGDRIVVEKLIETGHADVDAADLLGDTALITAARSGHIDVAKLVAKQYWASLDHVNKQGLTARQVARANGHYTLEKALVEVAYERRVVDRCPTRIQCAALSPQGRTTAVAACMRGCCMDAAWYFFYVTLQPWATCLDIAGDTLVSCTDQIVDGVAACFCGIMACAYCNVGSACVCCAYGCFFGWVKAAASAIVRLLYWAAVWVDLAVWWTCCNVRAEAHLDHGDDFVNRGDQMPCVTCLCGALIDCDAVDRDIVSVPFDTYGLCRTCRPDKLCCEECLEVDGSIAPWVDPPSPPPPPPPPPLPSSPPSSPSRGGTGNNDDAARCAVQ